MNVFFEIIDRHVKVPVSLTFRLYNMCEIL